MMNTIKSFFAAVGLVTGLALIIALTLLFVYFIYIVSLVGFIALMLYLAFIVFKHVIFDNTDKTEESSE